MEVISRQRLVLLFFLFSSLFLFFYIRLAYLQFFHPRQLGDTARKQARLIQELPPFRGRILDRNGAELALDLRTYSLGANARKMKNKKQTARSLSQILGLTEQYILDRLYRDRQFIWIARKLSKDQMTQIQALGISELEFRPEWKRIYPNKDAASHVIGFTGLDHHGLDGIELFLDSYLKGIPGWKSTLKDAMQREVVSKQMDLVLPVDGYDVQLTLDVVIQHMADKYLAETVKKYNALAGAVIVMDAANGEILAMSNNPQFDSNAANQAAPEIRRNRAITDIYEPGSVFKIFTLAAALEENAASLEDKLYCERGTYRTGGRILHDVHAYDFLTIKEVIAKSSNIGTAKLAEKVGKDKLYYYIRKFGFGEKTGVDLHGEIDGILRPTKIWSKTSISSIAMGQEIGLNALQLAAATAAIANGGVLMKPIIIREIRDDSGRSIKKFDPQIKRRVISKKTADQVQEAMIAVVETGTGAKGGVKGLTVGGKTGTAQKIEPDGSYSHSHFVSSFGGFVHFPHRSIVIVVSIDDPRPQYYGGTVAAPVFSKIAQGIMEYWNVRPKEEVV